MGQATVKAVPILTKQRQRLDPEGHFDRPQNRSHAARVLEAGVEHVRPFTCIAINNETWAFAARRPYRY